jgi:hypothetical protein
MSHDTLDDRLRERLHRLGRGATAGSLPWPAVDQAIRRQRLVGTGWTAALAIVALLVAAAVTGGGGTDGGRDAPVRPAGPDPTLAGLPYRSTVNLDEFPEPWPTPPGPYVLQYETRRLQLPGDPACREQHVLDLSQPVVQRRTGLSDVVRTPCGAPDAPRGRIEFPLPWTPVERGAGPEECAAGLRDPSPPGPGRLGAGSAFCVLTAPPPGSDRDGMIARFTVTAIDGAGTVYLEASAWLGSGPTS